MIEEVRLVFKTRVFVSFYIFMISNHLLTCHENFKPGAYDIKFDIFRHII